MTLWSLFLASLTTLGVPSSLIYFIRSRPERSGDLVATGIVMSGLIGIVSGVVGVLCMPYWLHQYPAWVTRDAQWLMILTPICSLTIAGRAILEAKAQFSSSNFAQIVNPLITLALLLALLLTHRLTVLSAAFAYCFSIFPVAAVLIKQLSPFIDRRIGPTQSAAKMLLHYGVRSCGIDILGTLSAQVDQVLVVSLLTPAFMGLYVVMLSLSRIASVFQNSVTAVLFPKATGEPKERILQLTGQSARVTLVITACATCMIGLVGPFLLRVFYGKDYTSAITCLRILLVEVTLSGLVFILAQAFMALNRPGTVSILQAIGLALSVPLMLLLIPKFGITGAALSLLLSTTARLCFILIGFRVYLKVPVPDLLIKREDFHVLLRRLKRRPALVAVPDISVD
jgi:O-antigen/teichoic acid export membrane protein